MSLCIFVYNCPILHTPDDKGNAGLVQTIGGMKTNRRKPMCREEDPSQCHTERPGIELGPLRKKPATNHLFMAGH